MPNLISKSKTWLVILAGVAILILVAVLFGGSFAACWEHRPGFKIGLIVGVVALAATAIYWASSLSDPAYEAKSNRIWLFIVAFAFCFIWICGWSAQYKADKSDNIEYNGK